MSTQQKTAGLIFGGASPEHDVSIQSAAEVAGAMERLADWRPAPIYVTREGRWLWPREAGAVPAAELVRAVMTREGLDRHYQPQPIDFAQALLHLVIDGFDTNMIMIHGAGGEDGRLQGALELAGLRFTGSGSAASALAMDKSRCQALFASRGLPIPRFAALDRDWMSPAEAMERALGGIGLPCVVKPSLCGSSVGLSIVREATALPEALAKAFALCPVIQAEELIAGNEFTCGVLDLSGRPEALPVTQIIPPEGRTFDYDAKYTPGVTREVTPAQIPDALTAEIQRLAVEAHRIAGCEGFSRVDFMVGGDGPRILEINTVPGMTGTSLLPQAAAVRGIDMPGLVRFILEHSMRRGAAKKSA